MVEVLILINYYSNIIYILKWFVVYNYYLLLSICHCLRINSYLYVYKCQSLHIAVYKLQFLCSFDVLADEKLSFYWARASNNQDTNILMISLILIQRNLATSKYLFGSSPLLFLIAFKPTKR